MEETTFQEYETHFTVMNYGNDMTNIRCEEFMKMFDEEYADRGIKFADLNKKVHKAIADCFIAFQARYGKELEAKGNLNNCRALYGVDVMIDQDLKPWLIEVNASPALSSDNERDYELKFNLIEDFYTCLVRDQAPSLLLVGGLEALPVRRRLSSALGHSFDFWRLRVACAGYGEGVPRADAQTRGRL
jgi:hypothetical protein